VGGRRAGEDKDAGADDGTDPHGGDAERAQRLCQAMAFGLSAGDDIAHRFACHEADGGHAFSSFSVGLKYDESTTSSLVFCRKLALFAVRSGVSAESVMDVAAGRAGAHMVSHRSRAESGGQTFTPLWEVGRGFSCAGVQAKPASRSEGLLIAFQAETAQPRRDVHKQSGQLRSRPDQRPESHVSASEQETFPWRLPHATVSPRPRVVESPICAAGGLG
jgi:hypothetical protein